MSYIQDTLNQLERPEYKEDSLRIQRVAMTNGVILTLKQAENVWQRYSDDMSAGWLKLPKTDEEIWRIIG